VKTQTVLYVFSGLAVVLGVVLLFLLLNTAQAVRGYDIFFQLAGIAQLAQLILRPLQNGLNGMAIFVFILMLVIAVLLFIAGRLVARQARLVERVRVLEEKMEMLADRAIGGKDGNIS
jgi:hypothetical protein